MNIVLLDVYNLIHRARSGFTKGDYAIVYNFFRGLRPILEKLSPDKVYFVLEGVPMHRKETYSEYKSNRPSQSESFYRQKDLIIKLSQECMPFSVVVAPDLECDDLIANIAKYHDNIGDNCFIVSGDSDFLQVFDTCQNVKIYHPIKKKFLEKPEYNYLTWKSLTGDKSDNIPGIRGIGPKRAAALCSDSNALRDLLQVDNNGNIFARNKSLIRFVTLSEFTPDNFLVAKGTFKSNVLKTKFSKFGFKSMVTDSAWKKFAKTFENIK